MFTEGAICSFLGITRQRLQKLLRRCGMLSAGQCKLGDLEARSVLAEYYRDVGERVLRRPGLGGPLAGSLGNAASQGRTTGLGR